MTDARTAYREASARGVSPVQSVVRLYEQIIEDLRLALKAIEHNQIELRTNKVNHAILVIGHLQSRLNFQSGGKVAKNLDQFYDVLRRDLLEAQFKASAEMVSARIGDFLELREAWLEVARAENSSAAGCVEAVAAGTTTAESIPARADQKGLMSTTTIEILQRVNAALRSTLTRFQPERNRCSAVQARDLSALRSGIRCVADCLRGLPENAANDPALEREISEFRCNLEELKHALPGFHRRLLAEHTRLAAAGAHSVAASAWVQAHKGTL